MATHALNFGYNAGMKSNRYDWLTWGIIAVSLALAVYVSFIYKDPARNGTPEEQAEAAFEMRSSQMQN